VAALERSIGEAAMVDLERRRRAVPLLASVSSVSHVCARPSASSLGGHGMAWERIEEGVGGEWTEDGNGGSKMICGGLGDEV
jgi:hypothetical protein